MRHYHFPISTTMDSQRKFHILVAVVAFAVALLAISWIRTPRPFRLLRLATKLTQDRAIQLTIYQMNGTDPLQTIDENEDAVGARYEAPTIHDIIMSMKYHAKKQEFDGICAMNYNVPVSVCYMPKLGNEQDLVMFNLKMFGFSENTTISTEYSLLCDRGETGYGHERFAFAWFEWYDENYERNFLKVYGRLSRVMQSMSWLNLGVTVCDQWSAQQQVQQLY